MLRGCLLVLAAAGSLGVANLVMAQTGNAVNSGLDSDTGAMSAPNIDRVNGINANGTPRQQSPGSSMTNGAGNSAMTPGVAGLSAGTVTPTVGPTVTTHSTVAPTGGPSP